MTRKLYYTFDVTLKAQAAFLCSYDKFCGHLEHCHSGSRIPALSILDKLHGGYGCQPRSPAFGSCWFLHQDGCLFYKYYFEPAYDTAVEVREIQSFECKPEISLTFEKLNAGTWTTVLTANEATYGNVTVSIIGNYDQGTTLLTKKLVLEYIDPKDTYESQDDRVAYIAPASDQGQPEPMKIGDVQAKSPYATEFQFTPDIKECTGIHETLNCVHRRSPLSNLDSVGQSLPRSIGDHLLSVNQKGELVSELMKSSALVISLGMVNLNVRSIGNKVCPTINNKTIGLVGCYSCLMPAQLSISIKSNCMPGPISLALSGDGTLLDSSIFIGTTWKSFNLSVTTSVKCPVFDICLKGFKSSRRCTTVANLCLEEADLRLNRTTEGHVTVVAATPGVGLPSIGEVLGLFPTLNPIPVLWAACVGLGLLIILLFMFACVVTMIKR